MKIAKQHPRRILIITVFILAIVGVVAAILIFVLNRKKDELLAPEGWGYNDGVFTPGQVVVPFNADMVLYQGISNANREIKALQRLLNTKKDNYQGGGIFNFINDSVISGTPRLAENGVFDQATAAMLNLFTNRWDGTFREIAPLLGMNVPTA